MGLTTNGTSVVQCWCCNPLLEKNFGWNESRVVLYSHMARMATEFAKSSPDALGIWMESRMVDELRRVEEMELSRERRDIPSPIQYFLQ